MGSPVLGALPTRIASVNVDDGQQDSVSSSPRWWGHRLDQASTSTSLSTPFAQAQSSFFALLFVHLSRTSGSCLQETVLHSGLWLNKARHSCSAAQYTVRSGLVSVSSQTPSGLKWMQRSSSVKPSRPGGELKILCEHGHLDKALDVLLHMDKHGIVPTVEMYVCLLKACAKKKSLFQAKHVHAHLAKHRLESMRFLGESLVLTMVKCGSLEDALEIFHRLPQRTSFSWTAVISGYTDAGCSSEALRMYHCMRDQCVEPDKYTFVSVLRACRSISEGKSVHAELLTYGCESDSYIGTSLVDMYAKCGSIADAELVFEGLSQRDVVSWTAMLTAFGNLGQFKKVLELYVLMQEEGVSPDAWIIVSALQACGMLAETDENLLKAGILKQGKDIHAEACRRRYESDIFVGNALVTLYGKCGSVEDAEDAFQRLSDLDIVSWNAMLAGYAQQELAAQGLRLYEEMLQHGVIPDDRTFVSALQACAVLAEDESLVQVNGQGLRLKSWQKGKAIHALVCQENYESDVFLGSALVSVYGKSGSVSDAQDVFDRLAKRDTPVWNAILAAYVLQGKGDQALQLYREMQEEGVTPDDITLMCVLQACSYTGDLEVCQHVHQHTLSIGQEVNLLLANTLIHTYGTCASMVEAHKVFETLPQPNVVSWNAIIAGYARNGNHSATFQWYEQMLLAGAKPDEVTFLSVLSACGHAGLVERGIAYFESMSKEHGVSPEIEHYVTMVDLLGRAGFFSRVELLLAEMPMQPSLSLWMCLLAACRKHGELELGKRAFDCAVHSQPKCSAAYVMMSNIYSEAGLWDNAKEINSIRQKQGAWKKPGQCWIGFEQEVEAFVVGDCKQAQQEQLYALLGEVSFQLKMPSARNELTVG